jgi:hypothetical protein
MIVTTCDLCGTDKEVRAPFVTVWNGNAFDLCLVCARSSGLARTLDDVSQSRARRLQGLASPERES